ncbi:leucine-rich repeat-containing protein 71 isoform 7-T8 [Morphnus guianensis]
MRRRGERVPREKAAVAAEEEMKSTERKAEQGTEEYQCTGLLEQDFPELCARAGITSVPKVTLQPPPSFPANEEPAELPLAEVLAHIQRKYSCFQPCIQVEREHEDPRSVRAIFLRGWKIEGDMLGVLSQCLPALAGLQAVHLWKVGLTERLLPALAALLAHCPCLRMLSLEGNPLPEPTFHTLMGSNSTLAHLSLRNNSIGDTAARFIGQSLSTLSSSNRSLVSLVLSFNRISDLGAGYIAKVLGPFALTHAEVVERRRLLLAEALGRFRKTPKEMEEQSERPSSLRGSMASDKLPPAKHGKTPTKKKEPLRREEARQSKKPPELRAARSKDAKLSGQEKLSPQVPDPAKPLHPLLEEARQHQGSIILPGNRALLNLNLTHNHITERGLSAFLAALEGQQREKKPKMPGQQGLLCLSLEKNRIPPTSPAFAQLQELLPPLQDPLPKTQGQEEEQELGT